MNRENSPKKNQPSSHQNVEIINCSCQEHYARILLLGDEVTLRSELEALIHVKLAKIIANYTLMMSHWTNSSNTNGNQLPINPTGIPGKYLLLSHGNSLEASSSSSRRQQSKKVVGGISSSFLTQNLLLDSHQQEEVNSRMKYLGSTLEKKPAQYFQGYLTPGCYAREIRENCCEHMVEMNHMKDRRDAFYREMGKYFQEIENIGERLK